MTGQVIHNDAGAVVAELAFQRFAMISPHSNPNTTLFIVISGGGYVQVGEERARVNHGEAVVWPAGVAHGAYTDGSEMRAIVVELPRAGEPLVLEGTAAEIGPGGEGEPSALTGVEPDSIQRKGQPVTRAEGSLAERQRLRDDYDAGEGEPW